MPELPEVETVRRGLEQSALGKEVVSIEGTGGRALRAQGRPEFVRRMLGRTFVTAGRRGKYLLVGLDDGSTLVAHLRMSGQFVYAPHSDERVAHTHVAFCFADNNELRFIDPRTFGELFVATADELSSGLFGGSLAKLGPDPIIDGLSAKVLRELLSARRTSLKAFFLDQRNLAGVGNLYADEICFAARLLPARRTETLGAKRITRLAEAIEQVLTDAVAAGGSSLQDESYRDVFGTIGHYQDKHAVYGREDEPCLVCGRPIVRTRIAGRSAFFCTHCQS